MQFTTGLGRTIGTGPLVRQNGAALITPQQINTPLINASRCNATSIESGNFSRRITAYISGMVSGNNYDIVRIPPNGGITKAILRTEVWNQNIQANYSFQTREDIWSCCDSGGTPNDHFMGNVYSQPFSTNSGVINTTFSYDFVRSSGLMYIRLFPVCTGTNSAGALMGAFVEMMLMGDGALTAF